jgi:hypothetical protein
MEHELQSRLSEAAENKMLSSKLSQLQTNLQSEPLWSQPILAEAATFRTIRITPRQTLRKLFPFVSLLATQAAIICWVFALWLLGDQAGFTQKFFFNEGAYASPLGWLLIGFGLHWLSGKLDSCCDTDE